MTPPKLHIDAEFVITGVRRTPARLKDRVVILSGYVTDPLDPRRFDAVIFKEMEIHIHTDDGQSPYPLGHRLKITVTD